MNLMKKILAISAGVFGVLTVIFYITSLKQLDASSARVLGTNTVVNIQGTVFCAACAIICAINIVGFIILHFLENYYTFNITNTQSGNTIGVKTNDGGVISNAGSYWTCPDCKTRNPMSKIECKECGRIR